MKIITYKRREGMRMEGKLSEYNLFYNFYFGAR